ncbi:DUF1877 family protein [Actinomadura sp. DC4]|nr:DUF1877 family protein [Actinomadura sp. DC4]MDN3360156.1 DUF1877 family protein [Actinomadura sp. DC4]
MEIEDAQDESELTPAQARHFSTYETWDLLRFLLGHAAFPVDVIFGEEPLAEDEDRGYGRGAGQSRGLPPRLGQPGVS